jgi:hypothetical protein
MFPLVIRTIVVTASFVNFAFTISVSCDLERFTRGKDAHRCFGSQLGDGLLKHLLHLLGCASILQQLDLTCASSG